MFDEDDENRFPRITLWQFLKGVFGKLFLAGTWIAEFYLIQWIVDHLAHTQSDSVSLPEARMGKGAPNEKGSPSEP